MMDILVLSHILSSLFFSLAMSLSTTPKTLTDENVLSTTRAPTVHSLKPKHNGIPSIALRTVYVISALCVLVILYFILRAVCANRKKFWKKNYGRIKVNGNDNMELHRLSEMEDDDDDDLTLFDAKQSRHGR